VDHTHSANGNMLALGAQWLYRRDRRTLATALMLLTLPLAAAGQDASLPILTYQMAPDYAQYAVDGGPPGSVTAYRYEFASNSRLWSPLATQEWLYVDIHSTTNIVPGTYHGRVAYQFFLDPFSWPWWDDTINRRPRCEFDSAKADAQNATTPSGPGLVVPNTDRIYTWSVYFPATFSTTQTWADVLQFHTGGDWVSGQWPAMAVNGDTLMFIAPGGPIDVNGNSAIWTTRLSSAKDRWIDFALHAQWRTSTTGKLSFYVDGNLASTQDGPNFYTSSSGSPFYYIKQGYYRDPGIPTSDTFFQTPLLVSELLPALPGGDDSATLMLIRVPTTGVTVPFWL
jgi:hypothetical protein